MKTTTESNSNRLFSGDSENRLYLCCKFPNRYVVKATDMGQASKLTRVEKACDFRRASKQLEHEWCFFDINAENNFRDNFAKDFWSGWFELTVSKITRDLGYQNSAKGAGPDFLLSASDNKPFVAIEATNPKSGTSGNSAIPEFPMPENSGEIAMIEVSDKVWATDSKTGGMLLNSKGKPYEIPNPNAQRNLTLRITNILDEKRKQHGKWVQNRTIESSLPFVVAISPSRMEHGSNRWMDINVLQRALYGKGNELVTFSKQTRKVVQKTHREYEHIDSMENLAGSSIPLNLFSKLEYEFLSAVWFVEDSLFTATDRTLLLNPRSKNPINPADFPGSSWIEINNSRITHHGSSRK